MVDSKFKIAWQVESPFHSSKNFYKMVNSYRRSFDMILTYDDELIKEDPKLFKRCNFGGTTVLTPELSFDKKDKLVAIVHSGKQQTPQHLLRESIIKTYDVDVFGRYTGNAFNNIKDVLANYKFEVVVENINHNNYFSEKLTDCIACGCIPIYNGCGNINEYFDTNGIITFNTLAELDIILNNLDGKYDEMHDAIIANYNIVINDYYTNEDWLYNKYFKSIIQELSVDGGKSSN
jgi:hypothetical protein